MPPASPAETHAHDPSAMDSQWCCDFSYPAPALHTVEGAPIQKLANLLRAATDFDEIAGHLVDEYDLLAIELERIDALRAAVRALNGPPSRLADAHVAPATGGAP